MSTRRTLPLCVFAAAWIVLLAWLAMTGKQAELSGVRSVVPAMVHEPRDITQRYLDWIAAGRVLRDDLQAAEVAAEFASQLRSTKLIRYTRPELGPPALDDTAWADVRRLEHELKRGESVYLDAAAMRWRVEAAIGELEGH